MEIPVSGEYKPSMIAMRCRSAPQINTLVITKHLPVVGRDLCYLFALKCDTKAHGTTVSQ
jgi:hypothetical protein